MEPPSPDRARHFWLAAARSLAWRRNFAYWCDLFAPYFVGVSVLAAIVLLVLRLLGRTTTPAWLILVVGLLLAGIIAAFFVWRKRLSLVESLSCLDEIAHLRSRLVSAHAGIGPWPLPRAHTRDTARWHWRRLATPLLLAAVLLVAASQTPSLNRTQTKIPTEEPIAWTQVDSWLQTLEEAKVADPQALAALQDQLDELRQKPAEEWYEHNGLEAGDALRQRLDQGLREMRSALEQSSKALDAMQPTDQPSTLAEMQAASVALQQALQGLKSGNLPPNKDLLERLQKAASGNPRQLSAQQAAELQRRINEGMKACDACVSPQIAKAGGKKGKGGGGLGGGGENADLTLDDRATRLQSQRVETSATEDMSNALPGDLLAIKSGSQDVDRTAPFETLSAGEVSTSGAGGDAVWRDSVTPGERQVLERYFK